MGALDQIVDINITQQTRAVPQEGFGIPLILGSNAAFSERIRYYSSAQALLEDDDAGIESSDPEYIYITKAFSQSLKPDLVGIGRRLAAVAQKRSITVNTLTNSFAYTVTINGTVFTYTSDSDATEAEIVAGLKAAINGGDEPVTADNVVTTTLTVEADNAGEAFTLTAHAKLTVANTTANQGVAEDLAAIIEEDNTWYGVTLTDNEDYNIKAAAAYVETLKKILIVESNDSDIKASGDDDLCSYLKGLDYKRTALIYTGTEDGKPAAWLGGQLPQVPGASTWKFKQLTGCDPDTLTDTERVNLIGTPGNNAKNANIYETVGGVPIAEEGWMVGGQFIDITVGLDWLESRMQTNVYALLANAPKIPYTNAGAAMIENVVRQTLLEGAANGLIDASSIVVEAEDVLDQATNDRANRIYPGITFECRLAGAFHFIQIQGNVTV